MKHTLSKLIALTLVLAGATACLGDLDTLPLNDTDFTSEKAYSSEGSYLEGLAYINAYWLFVSQGDPGSSDLDFSDAGQSELCRQYMLLNELPTGSFSCSWGDDYIGAIRDMTWSTTDNGAIIAVYTRCLKGIALANEYLLQTTDEKLDARGHSSLKNEVHGYRAEARFHRAMYNYLLMDLFGNPPQALPENIGGDNPKQIQRADLFKWIENECLELLADDSDMPKKGEVAYPRPTQGSVAALLARMYLNAEVYTGTARWEDARTYAKKVIDMGYVLHDNYQELFMEDNTTNGAAEDEFIFGLDYDTAYAQSWGGTTTLCSAAFNESMQKNILSLLGIDEATAGTTFASPETWNGYFVDPAYVSENFELNGVNWGSTTPSFGYDRAASDKRAFFYNYEQSETFSKTSASTGWRCWKWMPITSTGHVRNSSDSNGNYKLASADFPVFRLAEMYLIYAEAQARLDGGTTSDATALDYINRLRTRGGVSTYTSVNTEQILKERAVELMWEGHRRTDLIRYGKFTTESYRNIYPIIMSDLNANSNLTQNPGYNTSAE